MRSSSVAWAIQDVLSQKDSHLTAHEVYIRIRDRLPAVNPSTVYRALDRLAAAGKISVSDMGTGAAVYETVADGMHHHLVCQKCQRVTTIGHEEVKQFFSSIEHAHGYHILTNHLVLFGICLDCAEKDYQSLHTDEAS